MEPIPIPAPLCITDPLNINDKQMENNTANTDDNMNIEKSKSIDDLNIINTTLTNDNQVQHTTNTCDPSVQSNSATKAVNINTNSTLVLPKTNLLNISSNKATTKYPPITTLTANFPKFVQVKNKYLVKEPYPTQQDNSINDEPNEVSNQSPNFYDSVYNTNTSNDYNMKLDNTTNDYSTPYTADDATAVTKLDSIILQKKVTSKLNKKKENNDTPLLVVKKPTLTNNNNTNKRKFAIIEEDKPQSNNQVNPNDFTNEQESYNTQGEIENKYSRASNRSVTAVDKLNLVLKRKRVINDKPLLAKSTVDKQDSNVDANNSNNNDRATNTEQVDPITTSTIQEKNLLQPKKSINMNLKINPSPIANKVPESSKYYCITYKLANKKNTDNKEGVLIVTNYSNGLNRIQVLGNGYKEKPITEKIYMVDSKDNIIIELGEEIPINEWLIFIDFEISEAEYKTDRGLIQGKFTDKPKQGESFANLTSTSVNINNIDSGINIAPSIQCMLNKMHFTTAMLRSTKFNSTNILSNIYYRDVNCRFGIGYTNRKETFRSKPKRYY